MKRKYARGGKNCENPATELQQIGTVTRDPRIEESNARKNDTYRTADKQQSDRI